MGKRNRERRNYEKPCKSEQLVPVPIGSPTPLANLSLNSVLLHDWWLCMVQPRGLEVGGFECRGRQGQRVLCSAAIAKRDDATTLETADGITVAISGFINTSRTLQNGFSPKVCSHFLFGFPYDWEEYASHSNEQSVRSSTEASIATNLLHSNAMSLPLPALDNLHVPAARKCDLLMLSAGDSPNSVSDHMLLQKLSTHDSQNAAKVIQNHVDDNNISFRHTSEPQEDSNYRYMDPEYFQVTYAVSEFLKSIRSIKELSNNFSAVNAGEFLA
ncbi:SANT associated [Gossypium australe]|uniref:SANT associated n=1 Tax=Gossypium australe TaxID=47621 RepID=A0A5B6WXV2_9ROSI|nr:SANT associated [Gossypium australe]